jgi:uncharacterized protein
MKWVARLFGSSDKNSLNGSREVLKDSRLQILNVTRQTVLANRAEVADTAAKRNKGLLGRDGLAAGEGLWIVPCEGVHTFGMRFPIDLVYLDRNKRVKKVRNNVPAYRLSACLTAHSILELPSGTVHKTQTRSGDVLDFMPAVLSAENDSLTSTQS